MRAEAVILAGGAGRRMGGGAPKPLLELAGRPLALHVAHAAAAAADRVHLVHGPELAAPMARLAEASGAIHELHVQPEPRGTADALARALPAIRDDAAVLALCADTPLLTAETLRGLLAARAGGGLALLTVAAPGSRLGRILRDAAGRVAAIREYADASEIEREAAECNSGVLAAAAADFRRWLAGLDDDNAQGELYLTDCAAAAVAAGAPVWALACDPAEEGLGVNTPQEYAAAAAAWQARARARLMARGALLEAPDTVWLSADTEVEDGGGARLGPGVVCRGRVRLARGAAVAAHALLEDCELGADARVEPFSVVHGAKVGARCRIGPFARIRPETRLAADARVGNFVEVKNSALGAGSRAGHLAYVGDSRVGRGVNIGAGAVTCNYDGARKHATVIGDDAFIGSGALLIAPVEVGAGATVGAGTTLTRDAPAGELTVGRARAATRPGWRRPRKP